MLWTSGPLMVMELLVRERIHRARTAPDRGASAIEWVIISAILVVIAGALGALLYTKVMDKANTINLDTGP